MTAADRDEPRVAPAWRGLVLVCLAGIIWGTIGPAVEVIDARSELSVYVVGAYRAVAAVIALLLMVVVARRLRHCRALLSAQPLRVVAVGAFTATFMVLFFVAVVSIGVSVATVVALGWAPVMLQLLRMVRERHAPPASEVLIVGAAIIGLLLISTAGGGNPDPSRPALGIITALGSGTAYALSAEIAGSLKEHDALSVATLTMTVAAVVLVATGLVVALARGETLTTSDGPSWLLMVYLGVGTMALAYVLLFAGLQTTPSRTTVVATLLEPLTAVLIAALFLGERLGRAGVLGALLILAAVGSLGRRPPALPVPQ